MENLIFCAASVSECDSDNEFDLQFILSLKDFIVN